MIVRRPVMLAAALGLALLVRASLLATPAPPQRTPNADSSGAEHRAVLNTYCVTCHNGLLRSEERRVGKECRL